ncbi:MAG: hypothetical protein RR255_00220 [Bacilli bacterium]
MIFIEEQKITKEGVRIKKERVSHCIDCMRDYPISNFYPSKGFFLGNAKVIPYCKSCCEQILRENLKRCGTLESALWITCSKLDVPFIKRVFESTVKYKNNYQETSGKDDSDYNIFGYYYMFLWGTKSMQKKGEEWNDFKATDVAMGEIQVLKKSEDALKLEMEKFSLDWGHRADIEDYQYLEYEFDRLTKDKPLKPQEETLYRKLCIIELVMRKKEETNESTNVEQSQMLNLMKTLKIDNFSEDKDLSLVERMLENQIAIIEKEKPCFHYKDLKKNADFVGRGRYWEDHVIRPLRNLLCNTKEYKIKRDNQEEI